jgi:hypothetical protein
VLSETEHFIDGTRSEMRFNQLQYNVRWKTAVHPDRDQARPEIR